MQKLFLSTALSLLLLAGPALAGGAVEEITEEASHTPATPSTSDTTIEDELKKMRATLAEMKLMAQQTDEELKKFQPTNEQVKAGEEQKRKDAQARELAEAKAEYERLQAEQAVKQAMLNKLKAEEEAKQAAAASVNQESEEAGKSAKSSRVGQIDAVFGAISAEDDQGCVKFASIPSGGRDSDWYVHDGLLGLWYADRYDGPEGKHYRYYPGDASVADVSIFDGELEKLRANFDLKIKGVNPRYEDSSALTNEQKGGNLFKGFINGKFF